MSNNFNFTEKRIKVLREELFFGQGYIDVLSFKIPLYKDINFTTRACEVRLSKYEFSHISETRQDHAPVNINPSTSGSTLDKIM